MRYPAEQKAKTREKILAAAARSFREHGSETNGIGHVMKELGLTKGGFYRHFESKGDLYAAAVARAFEELGDGAVAAAEGAPKGMELRAIIEEYLSAKHVNDSGAGCPLAALGPEIARQPIAVRKRINQAMAAFRERMLPFIPGRTVEEKRARGFLLFPGMAGILMAARAIVDPQGRERMLAAARSFYVESFASGKRS
ncbi:MAG TPA: TetR/AcrR family transcriptional regulator [Bryobacteraceae bacterium]|jgi:TetR/AcrR family transcriptional repressor of nem operon|nr:TetR/AcrR family transcriptional regulator [Bryobacteraceae bacterium]